MEGATIRSLFHTFEGRGKILSYRFDFEKICQQRMRSPSPRQNRLFVQGSVEKDRAVRTLRLLRLCELDAEALNPLCITDTHLGKCGF